LNRTKEEKAKEKKKIKNKRGERDQKIENIKHL